MLAIGLMTGTSLDGLDVALCSIEGTYLNTDLKLIDFICLEMPLHLKQKIKNACDEKKSNNKLICSLNFELGYYYLEGVNRCLKRNNLKYEDISYIASHGQTIYHLPVADNDYYASTLQIGHPAILNYNTGIPVVYDFRVMDIAAGGQGAPLVPYTDYILYSDSKNDVALQNIGGIANVTYLSKSLSLDDIVAFDNGPGNMMINEATHVFYNREYDNAGEIARSGNLCCELFEELRGHDFLKQKPPKTTGREQFGVDYVNYLLSKYDYVDSKDIINTFTYFTAWNIVDSYRRFLPSMPNKMIVGGGGAYNKFMLDLLSDIAGSDLKVFTQEMLGLNSDAKEAMAFVVLGNETLNGVSNNVPRATGAKSRVVLGSVLGLRGLKYEK